MARRSRHLGGIWADDDATSDVEYILLLTFVVAPLAFWIPWFIIRSNAAFFDRVNVVVNLPFP